MKFSVLSALAFSSISQCLAATLETRQAAPDPGFPILKNPIKTIDVQAGIVANGTPVQINDLTATAQRWTMRFDTPSSQIRLVGTDHCLDGGENPQDGTKLKIWQCFDNLPAQQWQFTKDRRFILAGTGLCLDVPDGNTTVGNIVQVWTCWEGTVNDNQVWTLPAENLPPGF
ncbi:20 kDa protein having G-X-X-X-Q-X-W motif-containing protein [Coprinopsis sp. MPI-PUGE-AT-0042]|nr:20 kDa protein having G-X-X-X-Q-X-W motif-containing protein [Coprinopsis sp. MPI-PUGE-AT-0042]